LVAQLVAAQRYKPAGHGFNSWWGHWIFQWLNPSNHTMALGLTQPMTEMNTRDASWVFRWPMRRSDDLTTYLCWLSGNPGSLKFLES
jgi:hypothetical protein